MIGRILGFTPTHRAWCEWCGRTFVAGEGVAVTMAAASERTGARTAWYCSPRCASALESLLAPYTRDAWHPTPNAARWRRRFVEAAMLTDR